MLPLSLPVSVLGRQSDFHHLAVPSIITKDLQFSDLGNPQRGTSVHVQLNFSSGPLLVKADPVFIVLDLAIISFLQRGFKHSLYVSALGRLSLLHLLKICNLFSWNS